MTRSAAELTADAIVAAGLGTSGAGPWPAGVGREPVAGPVDVITTFDTGGLDPLILETEGALRRPTVQVRVRSAQYNAGWQKANRIYQVLGTTYSGQYGPDRVVGFVVRGDVLYLGRDDQDRFLFSLNFELMRDQPCLP